MLQSALYASRFKTSLLNRNLRNKYVLRNKVQETKSFLIINTLLKKHKDPS